MPYSEMPYNKDRIKRLAYWREYRRKNSYPYIYKPYINKNGNSVGYKGEELALKVLVGSKKIMHPCDLDWNGKLVDVKTAKPTVTNRGKYRWKFLLKTQKEKADLYLLICKDFNDKVIDIYLIPNTGKNNLSFSENTKIKYSQYLLSL